MKTLFTLIFSSLICLSFAQEEAPSVPAGETKPDKTDQLMLDVNMDYLLDVPDSVHLEFFSRGVGINLLYDLPFGSGNVGIAFGLAMGAHNYFSNAVVVNVVDSTDNSTFSVLQPFSDTYSFKKNKLTVAYLDVPLELRFRTNENENGKRFKIFAGGKIGYRINTHSKLIDDTGKHKGFDDTNMNPFRYGVSFRLAYGNIGLYGYYGLSTLFEDGKGVKLTPFSAGITIYLF